MSGVRHVDVGGASPYRIAIGDGLLRDGPALAANVRGRHALIVSDAHVAPLYARDVADAIQGARPDVRCIVSCLPAGEASKTLDRLGELLRELADFGVQRGARLREVAQHRFAIVALQQGPRAIAKRCCAISRSRAPRCTRKSRTCASPPTA